MRSLCEEVEDFFDGELPADQADRFRDHAATCSRCQRELTVLAQLRALEMHYRPELEARFPALVKLPPSSAHRPSSVLLPRWHRATRGAVASLGAMAAALLVWFGWDWPTTVPKETFYPGNSHRLADGRSSHPLALEHRPLAQGVLGREGGNARSWSYDALSKLQRAGDVLGVAAAQLVRGTLRDAEEALSVLESAEQTADVLSELAFAHLIRADADQWDAEEALRLVDRALDLQPEHGPALWNRALALKALGLPLMAAKAFDDAASPGEPGWSGEARSRAKEIRAAVDEEQKTWLAAIAAGKELVSTGARPSTELLGIPVLRHFFYDAVRARSSREEVELLRPIAREMDSHVHVAELEKYVDAVASQSFAVRGPLAAEYRRLAEQDSTLDATSLLRRLREADQPDLLLGALAKLPATELRAGELEALARTAQEDTWLHTLALSLQARALEKEHPEEARKVLERLLQVCHRARLDYRCAEAEFDLSYLHDHNSQMEEAGTHARLAWGAAIRARDWAGQKQIILELAQLARQREDRSVARAYYEEGLERAGDMAPKLQAYAHQGLAVLDFQRLRVDDARQHIDAALATGLVLGLPGALALSDIARLKPDPQKDAAAMEAFGASRNLDREWRNLTRHEKAERALAEHALGRWKIERNHLDGEPLLREAIRHASDDRLATVDESARRALAYSYTSLILDAGKRGDAVGALQLFEEEAGGTLPARCSLAVTADSERILAVVLGAEGGPPVALYYASQREPLPSELWGFLPRAVPERLSGCPRVDVLARAPLHGRPGLLPSSLAWSYRETLAPPPPPTGPRRHLVVQDVALSPARLKRLKPPRRWQVPREPVLELHGKDATPSMVMRRMEDVTDVTFVVHALVQPESDEAYLVLAPDGEKDDALRASDVQQAQLRGHPLVVLAACRGAHPAPVLHEARSLPAAFLRAGARAVLAASHTVPDSDGPKFFDAVRARIRAGADPAEALRAERVEWTANGRGAPWLDGVLLFE